ncbi:hypothetical protein FE257_010328 [Aspergillus nanangensis]|uniref:Fe2OG dioxygenase domain-containing protein n=1 Tax=Aspergillus nanangensis TaxID=2582783 RepID=A0AAD4CJG0_ASPNN|nr:hypothetical protein FE257_010328 [Aspergillus nanangensis]
MLSHQRGQTLAQLYVIPFHGFGLFKEASTITPASGGGCTKDAAGNLTLMKDQDNEGATITSIMNSKRFNIPVGIVIGDRNPLLGRKVPHRYNVMAYFRITDIWVEKVGQKKGTKVRFQKLDLSAKSWWSKPGSQPPTSHEERDFSVQPEEQSVVSGTLTAHFAVNYYVVSVDSKGFSEAPDGILHALGRLTWATETAVSASGDSFLRPNELLVLGYFEEMKIGYHDDGESSLGPTIATLSLGAKSTMFIRMKYKYFNGFSKAKKLLAEDPVLPNCNLQVKRQELRERYHRGEIDQIEYDDHRHRLFKGVRGGEATSCIKMELNHGDLVVMHGEKLQKYYEHSVVPDNKLRFALTARYIKPEQVDRDEWVKGDFTLSPAQRYDGK